MIRILGRKNSINVMKPMWCLNELGVPHERLDYGGAFGKVEEEVYLQKNPNGRIPTLEDGEFNLWESNVIVRYLAEKYGMGTLFPADSKARWLAEQWMDWMQTALSPAMMPAFWGLVRTAPEERSQSVIDASVKATNRFWLMLETHLQKQPYIGGQQFSMGDIPLGCAIYRWNVMQVERPEMPGVQAWYLRLQERSAYREHVMQPLT